jgi:hypothetical protein
MVWLSNYFILGVSEEGSKKMHTKLDVYIPLTLPNIPF